jgi:beta-glucanase (GH16 family)
VVAAFMAATAVFLPMNTAQAAVPTWTKVFHDDFRTPLNPRVWGAYSGQPGGNPYGMWSPKHLQQRGSSALLRGYREGSRFVTAGMMLNRPQLYGKYLIRAQFTRGAGIEQVMLLWPVRGWPPELDFAEGGAGSSTMATAHWAASNAQAHFFARVDMRLSHVYGMEWTPNRVIFTLDGHPFGAVTGAAVPHLPMSLALQTHATRAVGPISAAVPREVTEYIDWVTVYRYH